jgi:3-phosphoshikimate 1-carboxyvinyltransferase
LIFAVLPAVSQLKGRIAVPGSKSLTNRALLLGALSPEPFTVRRPLACADTEALAAALSRSGVRIERVTEGMRLCPGKIPNGLIRLDVRESGTACRFLAAFAASTDGGEFLLTGSERLCERPIGGLVEALRALGAEISYEGRPGFPPLKIQGKRLSGGPVSVSARESSQFASALLLAAVRFDRGLSLKLGGEAVSRAYLTTTAEALASVGVEVRQREGSWEIPAGVGMTKFAMSVPGDYSSAVSMAGAVAVVGGDLRLDNLEWPSTQADAAAVAQLQSMGLGVEPFSGGLRVWGRAERPLTCRASDFPDAVPALAAVAAQVDGESVISGIAHLRLKESDRIEGTTSLLEAAGIRSSSGEERLHIFGRRGPQVCAPVLPTRGDHRLVMAAALLSLRTGGLVENPRSVGKSYPAFFRDLFH